MLDPALDAAIEQHVHEIIVDHLSIIQAPATWSCSVSHTLDNILECIEESGQHEKLKPDFLQLLLTLPNKFLGPDGAFSDESFALIDTIVSCLQNDVLKRLVAEHGILSHLVILYRDCLSFISRAIHGAGAADVSLQDKFQKQRKKANELSAVICDIAALWQFQDVGQLREDLSFRTLVGYLEVRDDPVLPYITCLILGNMTKTDWMATAMVRDFAIDSGAVLQVLAHSTAKVTADGGNYDSREIFARSWLPSQELGCDRRERTVFARLRRY